MLSFCDHGNEVSVPLVVTVCNITLMLKFYLSIYVTMHALINMQP